jgi:hypothetical protein
VDTPGRGWRVTKPGTFHHLPDHPNAGALRDHATVQEVLMLCANDEPFDSCLRAGYTRGAEVPHEHAERL